MPCDCDAECHLYLLRTQLFVQCFAYMLAYAKQHKLISWWGMLLCCVYSGLSEGEGTEKRGHRAYYWCNKEMENGGKINILEKWKKEQTRECLERVVLSFALYNMEMNFDSGVSIYLTVGEIWIMHIFLSALLIKPMYNQ